MSLITVSFNMNKFKIGIDIGGTNTDAVLIDAHDTILASHKTTTTNPVEQGFATALAAVLNQSGKKPEDITGVFVGTTHATNALLQKKELYKVGILRLSSQATQSLPPCFDWPQEAVNSLYAGHALVDGGYECDGRLIKQLDRAQIEHTVQTLLAQGMESLAIVGVFAPLNHEQELQAANIAHELLGKDFPVSVSHKIGGVGFIERENSTILNAALKKSMRNGFSALSKVLREQQLSCSLFFTQNNGTILPLEDAVEYPILTISAGPTNSFVGSMKLARLHNAIVVDIGGTSTDVGIVLNGFPRRSAHSSEIAGISLNFPMPDVLSVGLGGGSYIKMVGSLITVGPESCGKDLLQEALSFGGQSLTVTDFALQQRFVKIPGADASRVKLTQEQAQIILEQISQKLNDLTRVIAGANKQLPIVLTGGGSALFAQSPLADKYIIPENAAVANAYGAALAEISGSIDTVVSLENRETVLADLEQQARELAVTQGADAQTLRLVHQEIMPYHYMPNALARVKITVAGR